MTEIDVNLNMVIIGESGVGKTSLLMRYIHDEFGDVKPTVGIDYMKKTIENGDQRVLVRFWDTAGTEKFSSLTDNSFRSASGVFLVYDVSNRETFDQVRMWLLKVRDKCRANIKIMLIGNKVDLMQDRKVSADEGEKFAAENGLFFFETSAKVNDKQRVQQAFNTLSLEALKIQEVEHEKRVSASNGIRTSLIVREVAQAQERKKNCCN